MKRYPITEWRPFEDLLDFPKFFGKWFEFPLFKEAVYPAVDVIDEKDRIIVKAELPGMNKDDIDITVEDGVLTIKGEKKRETEIKKEGYYHLERRYGSFHRVIDLPDEVDENKVKATYKDGVLEINLPKKEETKRAEKKIKIE